VLLIRSTTPLTSTSKYVFGLNIFLFYDADYPFQKMKGKFGVENPKFEKNKDGPSAKMYLIARRDVLIKNSSELSVCIFILI
jgi:hypothetical protein